MSHWSENNKQILIRLKNSLDKSKKLYGCKLEKYNHAYNTFLILNAVFGGLSTLLSAIATSILTINDDKYKLAALILNGIIFLLSFLISIFSAIVKIRDYQNIMALYIKYIKDMDVLYSDIAIKIILPDENKPDAIEYISEISKQYNDLISNNPYISEDFVMKFEEKYIINDDGYNIDVV